MRRPRWMREYTLDWRGWWVSLDLRWDPPARLVAAWISEDRAIVYLNVGNVGGDAVFSVCTPEFIPRRSLRLVEWLGDTHRRRRHRVTP